jgi:hypothetical protein
LSTASILVTGCWRIPTYSSFLNALHFSKKSKAAAKVPKKNTGIYKYLF